MDRAGDRAAVVSLHGDHLLVIRRRKLGRRYAVLPGGGVEPETSTVAALRELREETGLTGTLHHHLWTLVDDVRSADYFLVSVPVSPMAVSGPEVQRQSPDNSYEPAWIPISQLDGENLQPEAVRSLVRQLVDAARP